MDEPSGYSCGNCKRIFPAEDLELTEDTELADELYGRPPSVVPVQWASCPFCHSRDLEGISLCDSCGEHEAADGSDQCQGCIDVLEQPPVWP